MVVGGGAGLGGGLHLALGVDGGAGGAAGGQDALQQPVHDHGGAGLDGLGVHHVDGVVQNDLAGDGVLHDGVEVRGHIFAAVAEHLVGGGELHQADALGEAAQHHGAVVRVRFGEVGHAQGVVGEAVHIVLAHPLAHPHRDGVLGFGDGGVDGDQGAVAEALIVFGPVLPDVGVCQHLGGVVLKHFGAVLRVGRTQLLLDDLAHAHIGQGGGVVDEAGVDAQGIGRQRLHGGTHRPLGAAVLGGHRAVEPQVGGLFAKATHQRQHLAGIIHGEHGRLGAGVVVIHRLALLVGAGLVGAVVVHHDVLQLGGLGHLALQYLLLMPQRRDGVVGVEHDLLHFLLEEGVHGGVDAQAAVVDEVVGLGGGVAKLVLQLPLQHLVDRVGKVGVVGGGGDDLGLLLLRQHQGAGHRVVVFRLGQLALLVHQLQDPVAALQVLLGVGVGVVAGGVLGDGRDAGALRRGQLGQVVDAEVVGRARLDAGDGAGQAHRVEIRLQDGVLVIALVQAQGAEDLAQFAVHRDVVVAQDVLDELLVQGGSALHAVVDGEAQLGGDVVDAGGEGALEVHAAVLIEVLVLHADEGPLEIGVGLDLLQVHPFAVVAVVPFLGDHPLAGVVVLGQQLAGLGQLQVGQVQQLGVVGGDLHGVEAQQNGQHAAHHHPQADAGGHELHEALEDTHAFRLLLAAGGVGAAALPRLLARRAGRAPGRRGDAGRPVLGAAGAGSAAGRAAPRAGSRAAAGGAGVGLTGVRRGVGTAGRVGRAAGVGRAGAVEFPALAGTGGAGAVGAGGAGAVGPPDAAMLVGVYEDRLLCGKFVGCTVAKTARRPCFRANENRRPRTAMLVLYHNPPRQVQ